MSISPPLHARIEAMLDSESMSDLECRQKLIERLKLGDDVVTAIVALQTMADMSFTEAGLHLGHLKREDIDPPTQRLPTPLAREHRATPDPSLRLAHDPHDSRSEQIRTLRTELLLRHEHRDQANIVAVLSPCASEGRSQLAAELAIAFAQLGRPTLLVDADLRHPRQHLLFDAVDARGLSQALSLGQPPALQPIAGLPALTLLTAGPLPPNPLELLSDRAFEALVFQWRERYEFVVVDTPAVSRYADGLAVATIVGRVLSLSRAGHTSYRDTRDMLRRLAATQSRLLGAVINRF